MQRNFFVLCMTLIACVSLQNLPAEADALDGRILVKFDENILPITIEKSEGVIKTGIEWLDSISVNHSLISMREMFVRPISPELGAWYILDFPTQYSSEYLDSLFESKYGVIVAEPDYLLVTESPNDTYFGGQWFLETLETNSEVVWDDGAGVVGDPTVLIAIIDEGWNYMHPDFDEQIDDAGGIFFRNPSEEQLDYTGHFSAGEQLLGDGVDSDGNGFVDDRIGWDFHVWEGDTIDNNVWPDSVTGPNYWKSHGTNMAGIIAAQTNNGRGVAGIAGGWGAVAGCKVLPCRAIRVSEVAPAINYAVNIAADNGIDRVVFNCAIWFNEATEMPADVREAVDAAAAHPDVECLFVGSAGNFGMDEQGMHFPADYHEFICVAATDSNNVKWEGSNFGPTVDIAAPGVRIWTTFHEDDWFPEYYRYPAATSFCAAMVSGVAGLVWSAHPELTRDEIREWIESAAHDLAATEPTYVDSLGAGLLNAADAVTGTINWFGEKIIDSTFVVAAGRTLKIWPNTNVWVDSGVAITINGALIADGTLADPILFRARDAGEKWSGLKISGGSVEMDYVYMEDFKDYGIYTDAPTSVLIEHCHLDGGDLVANAPALLLWNAPSVTQTVRYTTIQNIPSGVGFYPYNSYVNLEFDTIRGCNNINSYIKKVSGHIHGCWFEGRTSTYAVYFNSSTCNPNLTCCTFKNLAPRTGSLQTTLYSASSCSPVFAGDYGTEAYPEKSNVIMDTSAYLLTFYGTGLKPTIHINDWYQNSPTGKFMNWGGYPTPAVAFDIDRQYWNVAPTTAMFSPANAAYWDWTPVHDSPWELCSPDEGGGGGSITMPGDLAGRENSLDSDPSELELLTEAMTLESREDFESARDAFQHLALTASATDVRWRAMVGCITTDVRCAISADWIERYVESLETLEGGGYQAHLDGSRLLYNHYLNQERYEEAIAECNTLLASGLNYSDSINVAVDLVGIQMAAGLVEYHGGLDGNSLAAAIPRTLQVSTTAEGITREFELLAALNKTEIHDGQFNAVPREFSLHANYPNPFNPTTTIEFSLPETAPVTLNVYNVSGQLVSTLVRETLNAGVHRVNFDATGFSSGVYFYRLEHDHGAITKKMLLLR